MENAASEDVVQQAARALLSADRLAAVLDPQLAARFARGGTPESLPRKGKLSKAQSGRQDSELTEPDSDDDSLLGDDPTDLPALQTVGSLVAEDIEIQDSLSKEELIQRRLACVKSLFRTYKDEYWALLEELRTRHERYRNQPQKSAMAMEGNAPLKRPASENNLAVRQLVKKQRTSPPPADGPPQLTGGLISEVLRTSQQEISLPASAGEATAGGTPEIQKAPLPAVSAEALPVDKPEPTAKAAGGASRGYASEEDPATFSDAEAAVLRFQDQPGAASKEQVQAWRADFRSQLPRLARMEQRASASSCRELDRSGAVACFCGRHNRFLVKTSAMTLGRATDSNQVDVDLSTEGDARKVSRLQAQLSLRPDGKFQLKNIGRRRVLVNNRKVDQGQVAQLCHLSLLEVGGARLLFMVNHAATKRASLRSLQLRNDF